MTNTVDRFPNIEDSLHKSLLNKMTVLPTDYKDYGGQIERWEDDEKSYPDCSCGCKYAAWLEGALSGDWCVCTKLNGPRFGLLTFEHMTGSECFTEEELKES